MLGLGISETFAGCSGGAWQRFLLVAREYRRALPKFCSVERKMADLQQLEDQIVSLSLLDAAALVKKLEERLGVSAAARAPGGGAGGGGGGGRRGRGRRGGGGGGGGGARSLLGPG